MTALDKENDPMGEDNHHIGNIQKSYLVIADESDEFNAALCYALNLADLNKGHVSVAHIQNLQDFIHWGSVEDMVRKDMRKKSEELLWIIAGQCNDHEKHVPSLYSREGNAIDVIMDILKEDPRICALILAAAPSSSNPGPLVKHFASKVIGQLPVPLIVVPGNLSAEDIEKLI
jgi:hypothetical protein